MASLIGYVASGLVSNFFANLSEHVAEVHEFLFENHRISTLFLACHVIDLLVPSSHQSGVAGLCRCWSQMRLTSRKSSGNDSLPGIAVQYKLWR